MKIKKQKMEKKKARFSTWAVAGFGLSDEGVREEDDADHRVHQQPPLFEPAKKYSILRPQNLTMANARKRMSILSEKEYRLRGKGCSARQYKARTPAACAV